MKVALKIDVDTYRGLATGAPRLVRFLSERRIPASLFVTLGPDVSGWAALRLLRWRGYGTKMSRTKAWSLYGARTVLSGTLWPARPMAASFKDELAAWIRDGFEVSPHGYNHILWHDGAARWTRERAQTEMERVVETYHALFARAPESFAAPGWQAGAGTWSAMEGFHLLYHSDTRGERPYFPQVDGAVLKTLEIPTTCATWDEMLAWDGVERGQLAEQTLAQMQSDRLNVWTIHAEVEGGLYFSDFSAAIDRLSATGASWTTLAAHARDLLRAPQEVPVCSIRQAGLPGRAGPVTCQEAA